MSTSETGSSRVKRGLAEMLKGGVIMDVVTAEQAQLMRDGGSGYMGYRVGIEAQGHRLGWTTVTRPEEGDLFLSLRNARRLPMTMLWHSNGGRDYAPWSGRHFGCLGVEEADPEFRSDVAIRNRAAPVRHVLSNSFGFGGSNCALVIGRRGAAPARA